MHPCCHLYIICVCTNGMGSNPSQGITRQKKPPQKPYHCWVEWSVFCIKKKSWYTCITWYRFGMHWCRIYFHNSIAQCYWVCPLIFLTLNWNIIGVPLFLLNEFFLFFYSFVFSLNIIFFSGIIYSWTITNVKMYILNTTTINIR